MLPSTSPQERNLQAQPEIDTLTKKLLVTVETNLRGKGKDQKKKTNNGNLLIGIMI